ncbi:MAG: ABC transporter substrate-binding protein [Usitatibacter sp.]
MPGRVGALAFALVISLPCLGAEWAAFIAPDLPQTRGLFAELGRRANRELQDNGLELRFVPLSDRDDLADKATIARAVADHPRVIFATSTFSALWAKDATNSIPVIFASVADPVRSGLVVSVGRPGGNLTGFTYDIPVEGKQFELLREIVPTARRIGVLEDGTWLGERITIGQLAAYEKALGISIKVFRSGSVEGLAKFVLGAGGREIDAWLVPISNTAAQGRVQLVDALRRAGKPAVFGRSFFVDAGGLAAFQEIVDTPMEIWHVMLREILDGIPPGQIPVQRPKRFELTINMSTARRLRLNVPETLLRRADRVVIE